MSKCLIVTTHFLPLHGGAQAVYAALAQARPRVFGVLTAKRDYTTGEAVKGIRAFDATTPYRINRLERMRTDMLHTPTLVSRLTNGMRERRLRKDILEAVCNEVRMGGYGSVCIGALDNLGWLVAPLRAQTGLPVILYTHGEEVSQKAYSERAERARAAALSAADGVVAVSSFTASLVAEKYSISSSKIRCITNGVDAVALRNEIRFDVRKAHAVGPGPIVFSLGRLVRRKGFDRLLEAWPKVLAAVPDAKLLIGGEGPMMDEIAEASAGQPSIFPVGSIEAPHKSAYFRAARVHAMPNRTLEDGDTEGFGLVFLEAGAVGTPSVGGRAGGVPDAIRDGETGILVDGDNPDEIADAIIRLLTDDELHDKMGAAARAFADSQDWKAKADELVAFLAELRTNAVNA